MPAFRCFSLSIGNKVQTNFFINLAGILIFTTIGFAQSIVNTVHNLSVSGPGTIKASNETEICIFCHTPHNSSPRIPLWNRPDPNSGFTYTLYQSSTAQALPEQPDGSTILCLSCHDGTIALGHVLSRENPIEFGAGLTTMPFGNSNLTTDLSDDHPVSFLYNSSLAATDGELVDPVVLTGPVKLTGEKLQCTSCHNPHDNTNQDFLVVTNQFSELCLYCHQKTFWAQSSHKISASAWNSSGVNPWFHTSFLTVAENACENCHNPHSAGGQARTMNYVLEENNCIYCHNGNVAVTNIEADILKTYSHNVYSYNLIHDPEENGVVQTQHVECEDCHNPHAVKNAPSAAPAANGFLEGIKGVDTNGNVTEQLQFAYELCYRCHTDSPEKPGSTTPRLIEQDNVRLEFDLSNPSFHPVEAAGTNNNVPSLISPYDESSIIYCTDCHASNSSVATGPHGSIYPHILKYNYETADFTPETPLAYELCYQCHDRNTIINSTGSFGENVHKKHIVDAQTPCNACHDPHGISGLQGNASNNTHLINFDISIVFFVGGRLEFIDNGSFSGTCYLRCHNRGHNPRTY